MKTFCLSSVLCLALSSWIIGADFIQNSNCGLTNPAFTEKFDQAYPGGKGGDLDETKWVPSRYAGSEGICGFIQADIPPCKQGAPSTAYPDSEILVCDNSMPGYSGRLMTPLAGQNYGYVGFRSCQPFDFAGRTGTIAFDVDAWSQGGLSHWVFCALTENPIPEPNTFGEHSGNPQNGMILDFVNCSSGQSVVGIGNLYHNFTETAFSTTQCYTPKAGFLNHFEVKVSQSRVEIWASDYSEDGITFPNFKMIASADNPNFSFAKGYVTFGVKNHATIKYGYGRTGVHYWDNIGFDGPVITSDRVYTVPDALTQNYSDALMNLAYYIKTDGIYTCCGGSSGKIAPFVLKHVNLTNATSATLAYNAYPAFSNVNGPIDPTKINIQYRLNGGVWRDRFLTTDEITTLNRSVGGFGDPDIPLIMDVPLTDLQQGDNTLDFQAVNASLSFPIQAVNIEMTVHAESNPTGLPMRTAQISQTDGLRCTINPFGSMIRLLVWVPGQQRAQVDICNAAGQVVCRLAHSVEIARGVREFVWNGGGQTGNAQVPGVYLVRAKIGDQRFERKIFKLR